MRSQAGARERGVKGVKIGAWERGKSEFRNKETGVWKREKHVIQSGNVFDSVCISFTYKINYYYSIISNNLKGVRNGNTI